MKRALCLLVVVFLLSACGKNAALDRAMQLRSALLQGNGCSFDAEITADYGDKTYSFVMRCQTDTAGALVFSVIAPESISGVTGTVDEIGGKLKFDEKALAFPNLIEGLITPVAAPWLLMHSMTGGYMKACRETEDGIHLIIDDSYRENTVQVELYCDKDNNPIRGEILWEGRRIVALDVTNFVIQ